MPRAAAVAALAIVLTVAGGGAMAQARAEESVGCVVISKEILCRHPHRAQSRQCDSPNRSPFCDLRQEPAVSPRAAKTAGYPGASPDQPSSIRAIP